MFYVVKMTLLNAVCTAITVRLEGVPKQSVALFTHVHV